MAEAMPFPSVSRAEDDPIDAVNNLAVETFAIRLVLVGLNSRSCREGYSRAYQLLIGSTRTAVP